MGDAHPWSAARRSAWTGSAVAGPAPFIRREPPVSDLIRIVYVSRSTFPPLPAEQGIEPNVARILVQSRMNNARRGLVGALYFGDGCFFQCLEGREAGVDRLYAALLADPRHTDLKVLSRERIDRTGFAAWSMKYVPLDGPMKALLRQRGLSAFDPYRFDEAAVAQVLALLREGGDITPAPSATAATASDAARDTATRQAVRVAGVALAMAALALLVACAALLSR